MFSKLMQLGELANLLGTTSDKLKLLPSQLVEDMLLIKDAFDRLVQHDRKTQT